MFPDILLQLLLAGHVIKTSELLPGFDVIKLRLVCLLALGRVGGFLSSILLCLQQDSVAVGLLPLLQPAISVLLPQQPPLLPDLLHPALVVVGALILGAASSLWLLVFSLLHRDITKFKNKNKKIAIMSGC